MSGYNDSRAFAPQLGAMYRGRPYTRPSYSQTVGAEGASIWDDVGANAGSVVGNLLNTSLSALESSGQRSIQQSLDPQSMTASIGANLQQNKWLYIGIGAAVIVGLVLIMNKK